MHIVNVLSNNDILKENSILELSATDVLSHMLYLNAKSNAEEAQMKYTEELNKNRRR